MSDVTNLKGGCSEARIVISSELSERRIKRVYRSGDRDRASRLGFSQAMKTGRWRDESMRRVKD